MASTKKRSEEQRKESIWKPFGVLLKNVKIPWGFLAVIFVLYMSKAQLNLIIPNATAKVVAGDISSGSIMFMVGCMFLTAILTSVQQVTCRIGAHRVELSFRKFMVKKALSLPMPYFDKHMANQLITRTTQDCTNISEMFAYSLPYIPASIYEFVGVFVILFSYNWRLAALEAIMIPIIASITFLNGRVSYKWQSRIRRKVAELGGYLAEALVNIPLIKVFVKEKEEEKKGEEAIDNIYKTKRSFLGMNSLVTFLTSAQNLIQTVIVVVGGSVLVQDGHITLDQWIAFYMYSTNLIKGIVNILDYYKTIKTAQGTSRLMAELAVEDSEDKGGSQTIPTEPGDIRFENVSFRYGKDLVLKDISFTLPKGTTTAIVGPSGAGKSTIFGLLERFYDPESGQVTLGGVDAKEFSKSSWRQAIGYVPQSSPLFSGSIRYNMTYGLDRSVTDEELAQAARDANIYDYIQTLPDGFDSDVGERGSKLSGGQRQRIAIARAILKDPKILLLDEATSSLDAETTYEIQKAMDRLKQGRTTVVVAHELRTVEDADQIVVLSSGTINGIGSDSQLTKDNELYRSLKELQNAQPVMGRA